MPLPDRIAIGPLVFRVTDDEIEYMRAVVEHSEDTWGRINYALGEIILDPKQNDAHKRMALLHELLHGCWHVTEREHSEDEKLIRILTGPLLDTLRRNPDLVAYLLAE